MRKGERINRYILRNISKEITKKELHQSITEEKRRLNLDIDANNRKYVTSKVEEYMKAGMSHEEAVDLIMEDKEIVEQFSYLTKNGLDIKQCFINFTSWINKNKDKQEHNKNGETR